MGSEAVVVAEIVYVDVVPVFEVVCGDRAGGAHHGPRRPLHGRTGKARVDTGSCPRGMWALYLDQAADAWRVASGAASGCAMTQPYGGDACLAGLPGQV